MHLIYASMSVHAAITVHFEEDMYMVQESDGMVDITLVASGRTSFEYTFTVTPMNLTATSKFHCVFRPCIEAVTYNSLYPLSVQTTLTTPIQPLHIRLDLLMRMNLFPHLSYPSPSLMIHTMSLMKTSN